MAWVFDVAFVEVLRMKRNGQVPFSARQISVLFHECALSAGVWFHEISRFAAESDDSSGLKSRRRGREAEGSGSHTLRVAAPAAMPRSVTPVRPARLTGVAAFICRPYPSSAVQG